MMAHEPPTAATGASRDGAETRQRRVIETPVEWLPVALVVIAEAAWISVLGGLIHAFAQRPPALGLPALVLFVVSGIVAARVVGRRADRWWPAFALGFIALGWLAGVLLVPDARAELAAGGVGAAATAQPGTAVAGLAVLRGFAHARLPLAVGTVGRLVALGIPGIAFLALVGGVALEPARTRFLADTVLAVVVFAGAGVLALTVARLGDVAHASGWDWRRNPAWLALTIAVLAVAILSAIPLAGVAGSVIEALIAIALAPMLIVGLTMGLDRTARRALAFVVGAAVVMFVLLAVLGGDGGSTAQPGLGAPVTDQPTAADDLLAGGLGGLLVLLAVTGILVLAALWMRRARPPEEDLVEETRTIDRGAARAVRRRFGFGRRPAPSDAVSAYVALVDDLDRHPDVRRGQSETPAEHAARLRSEGRAELGLDLLAGDYALARYGGVRLTEREDRRAVDRWRRLRRRLTDGRARLPGGPG